LLVEERPGSFNTCKVVSSACSTGSLQSWAHARRKFDEALQTLPKEMQKDAPAAIGECYCSRLFKLEQAFAELTPEERYDLVRYGHCSRR